MNKDDKQIIYEIYRACRLCGAGAGYKMPIIQSVIDLDGGDIELKQKIKECLQIEVDHNDRMPPLVCELCVDKVNDFFEFRTMCQETNKNTRLRLGLPPQTFTKQAADKTESILGITETVYINSDSEEEEPLSKQQSTSSTKSKPRPKSAKIKQEIEVNIKMENSHPVQNETARAPTPEILERRRDSRRKRPSSPKISTRQSVSDDVSLYDIQMEENSLLAPRQKRLREVLSETPPLSKKAKPAFETPVPEKISRPGPKSSKIAPKPQPPQKQSKPPPKAGPKSKKEELMERENAAPPAPKISKELAALAGIKTKRDGTILPGQNSKKLEAMQPPGPKSKKTEVLSRPGPKSKKVEVDAPGPKNKKVEVDAPGPKTKKSEVDAPGPKSKKLEVMSKPGPKSKKVEVDTPGPKSKKVEVDSPGPGSKKNQVSILPGPKSKKAVLTPLGGSNEVTSAPGPKSKVDFKITLGTKPNKTDVATAPGPKLKKREISPMLTSKSKLQKREPSPSPSRSRKRAESPLTPQPPSRASPAPQKSFVCSICGCKAKAAQGLTSHLKTHVPGFTPMKLACNACELWFATQEEANSHHEQHSNKSLPYTCSKCYDDFNTMDDYQLHFSRNQCLPTYEVPDVKCDECWRYFATYKLLEDHKCAGEGGRPGGKCSKCSRTYSLLKHQIAHEMKCNAKKKEEPIVDPKVSRRLLPMQVRLVKCDLLLKDSTDNLYDVSKLSHSFGLDLNCTYPYFYSMGDTRVKSEPRTNEFDPMVSINDEIKEEYLNNEDSYVHWDSDATDDSDEDTTTADNLLAKKKSVDALSTITLKTLFSPKCLGKVPRKKRKIKDEKAFESILSIDFESGIRSNIDKIINKLGNDSYISDNDSDSILDRTQSKNHSSPALDIFVNLKSNGKNEDSESDKSHSVNISCSESKENHKIKVNITENQSNTKQSTENPIDRIDSESSKIVNEILNDKETTTDLPVISNDASQAPKDNETVKITENDLESKLTNDSQNGHIVCNNENDSLHIEDKVEISTSPVEAQKMDVDEILDQSDIRKDEEIKSATDTSELIKIQDSETIESQITSVLVNDKLEIDGNSEQEDSQSSDVINDKVIIDSNHAEKDDSQSSSMTTDKLDSDNTHIDSDNNTADSVLSALKIDLNEKIDTKNEEIVSKLSSFKNSIVAESVSNEKEIPNSDAYNINKLDDEDKQLMADLDAQIGENEPGSDSIGENIMQGGVIGRNISTDDVTGQNELTSDSYKTQSAVFDTNDTSNVVNSDIGFDNCDNKKESLEEMMQKKDSDLRSLDLDSISDDEFNFDL